MLDPKPEYWVHNLDPIALHIYGSFGIRYYGLAYLIAFLAGYVFLLVAYRKGRSPLTPLQLDFAVFSLSMGVLIGGRLGYVFLYSWEEFIDNPLFAFQVWKGGMSSHGGFIGVALAAWWVSRRCAVPFLAICDLLCPIAPIGLLLGRIANFINGELWGKITTVPWAVIFPKSAPAEIPLHLIPPRHPSQLYEAFLEGLILLVFFQCRFWLTRAQKTSGRISGEFLLLYAMVRMIGELFREPDANLILGMSRGAFYSIFMVLAGCFIMALVPKEAPKK